MSTVAVITPAEFYDRPDRKDYELIDGRLGPIDGAAMEVAISAVPSLVGMTIGRLLGNYCEATSLAWVFGADCGYQCIPGQPDRVSKPTVSVVLRARLAVERMAEGWLKVAPDLAVEVVTPNDTVYDLEDRVADLRAAGTRLVWIVMPSTRSVRVHRGDGSLARLDDDGQLDGEDVLPGFSCPVAGLFPVEEPAATDAERGLA